MKIYQPWIEIGGSDGEYAVHRFSLHLHMKSAVEELNKKLDAWSKDKTIVIMKKGIYEIEVIE